MADLVKNKKAHFNYEILEVFEAGLDLLGTEVKALRSGKGSLDGARVIIRGNEAFLINANIPAFQPANAPKKFEAERNRKLLLTKKELAELADKEGAKGLTIIPISVYNKGRYLKVKIAIARGKKKFDKRESIKKKDSKRDMERTLKEKYR